MKTLYKQDPTYCISSPFTNGDPFSLFTATGQKILEFDDKFDEIDSIDTVDYIFTITTKIDGEKVIIYAADQAGGLYSI